eukprot:gene16044-biopygen9294
MLETPHPSAAAQSRGIKIGFRADQASCRWSRRDPQEHINGAMTAPNPILMLLGSGWGRCRAELAACRYFPRSPTVLDVADGGVPAAPARTGSRRHDETRCCMKRCGIAESVDSV